MTQSSSETLCFLKREDGVYFTYNKMTCPKELNNLNLGVDAYLALFTLIEAHFFQLYTGTHFVNNHSCTNYRLLHG